MHARLPGLQLWPIQQVAAWCYLVGCAGYVVSSEAKKAAPNKLQSLQASINIADRWARVYLARLCSAILYADWTSTQEFAKGQGKPFWTMLVLLATRCAPPHGSSLPCSSGDS